jgi:glycosidase
MPIWTSTAVVYHIYPLGLLGAPHQLEPDIAPVSRLRQLTGWTDHIRAIGCNTVYLGPVFASASHGYDTIDYRQVDPRLGTNDDLRALVRHWHDSGIRVVLDGVFNHVGRDHAHFRDLLEQGQVSPYRHWFADVDFTTPNPRGDAFSYTGWDGHLDLVKLNLRNPDVREELFEIVRGWFHEFDIDGLRLDAADVIDKDFLRDLAAVCRATRPDCWVFGEVVHGNYAEWIGPDMLDGVTNYEGIQGSLLQPQRPQPVRNRPLAQPGVRPGWRLRGLAALLVRRQSRCRPGGEPAER